MTDIRIFKRKNLRFVLSCDWWNQSKKLKRNARRHWHNCTHFYWASLTVIQVSLVLSISERPIFMLDCCTQIHLNKWIWFYKWVNSSQFVKSLSYTHFRFKPPLISSNWGPTQGVIVIYVRLFTIKHDPLFFNWLPFAYHVTA